MQHPDFIAAEESDEDIIDMEDDLHLANVDVDKVPRNASHSLTTSPGNCLWLGLWRVLQELRNLPELRLRKQKRFKDS